MMKVLQKLILLAAITVGLSLTAMAQRQDDKEKHPPKDPNPPKIKVEPKRDTDKPKNDNRNNDNRNNDRRKPEMALINDSGEVEVV